jgi:DNA-binding NarL/FixJ family response regulator
MDVCMPEMDDLQAIQLIKARWLQVKVVVLTLYGEYEAEALAAGADGFINKGISPDRLLAMLSTVAGREMSWMASGGFVRPEERARLAG